MQFIIYSHYFISNNMNYLIYTCNIPSELPPAKMRCKERFIICEHMPVCQVCTSVLCLFLLSQIIKIFYSCRSPTIKRRY